MSEIHYCRSMRILLKSEFSIIIVLLVPLLAPAVCKQWEGRRIGQNLVAKLREWGDNAQLLFLCLAVIAMFASESKPLFEHFGMLLRMLISMIFVFCSKFCTNQVDWEKT